MYQELLFGKKLKNEQYIVYRFQIYIKETMTTNPLKDIAFEDINTEYCYGKYGDFNVIMKKSNGYINATKMCQDISDH